MTPHHPLNRPAIAEPPDFRDFPDVHLMLSEGAPEYRLKSGDNDVTDTFPRPVHHALSGVAWGYHGSGPADLALMVLSLHLPPGIDRTEDDLLRNAGFPSDPELGEDYERLLVEEDRLDTVMDKFEQDRLELPVKTHSGRYVSRTAWDLHQTYKAEVIALLDQDASHVLTSESVQRWLANNGANDVRR